MTVLSAARLYGNLVKHPSSTSSVPALAILLALAPATASSQLTMLERGEEHVRLDYFVGEWHQEDTQSILGEERTIRSQTRFQWLPGGVWLRGQTSIRGLPGIPEHHGWYQLTWDPDAKEVVQVWTDNQTAILFDSRGNWTDETTLVIEGSHRWRGQNVRRKTIYRIESPDEYTREYFSWYEDGRSRRTVARHRRASRPSTGGEAGFDGDQSQSLHPQLSSYRDFVGSWRSSLEPRYHDHPMVKRFNPELKSQLLTIRPAVSGMALHLEFRRLDAPRQGEDVLISEGMALRNPSDGRIELVELGTQQGIFHRGHYTITSNALVRTYDAFFEGGGPRRFRETWRWTDQDRTHFEWLTERLEDGEWIAGDVIVDWHRVPSKPEPANRD